MFHHHDDISQIIPGYGQIMGKLALVSFGALALFEKEADHRLGVNALAHALDRLKEGVQLVLGFSCLKQEALNHKLAGLHLKVFHVKFTYEVIRQVTMRILKQ